MGGGKGGSTTVNKTEIPPEVLARYNAVNARAETVAQQPYQRYSNDPNAFVAGLTPTQMAGIQNVNTMAGAAQPYYGAATQQLGQAQQQGQGYLGAATGQLGAAQQTGQALGATAGEQYAQAANVAAPYYQAATANLGAGLGLAAPLNLAAAQSAFGAAGAAAPYYGAATRGTQAAIRGAQPYQAAATQAALAGSQAVSPGQLQTAQFLNPYTQNVVAATQAALGQQFGQQQAQQQAEAIRAGAFGGDRSGLQRAQLRGQQALAESQAIAPLYQQAYQNALQTAQQQQGVNLSAEQANRAALQGLSPQLAALGQQGYGQQLGAAQQMAGLGQALYGQGMTGAQTLSQLGQTGFGQQLSAAQQAAALGQGLYGQALGLGQAIQGLGQQQYGQGAQTAQQLAALGQQGYGMGAGTSNALANLGTNAQQAGLAGAQAQLQAGQQQQQTEQAGKQAMYNQFMQEQGYPFQVAQFLANIATGTGALSGNQSTSTTTGGGGFFSDKRLKENVQKVGETNDGQPIYRYNYKGDPRTQIGLMAQDVEKEHPEAVGLAGGYKTVDYKKATEDAVHKADGGGTTDAYSMDAPSQMLNKPAGLGALTLPQMRTEGIAVRSMTPASEIAGLLAPKATGFSPGTMEGKRAEAESLRSALSSGRGADLGSGPEYMQSRLSELDKFLAANASQGGLVGPEGGSFSRGGYAFGGGPYGVQLEQIAQRPMMQAQPGQRPAERNALAEAKQIGDLATMGYAGYKNRPDFLRSAEDVAARKATEAAAKVAELQKLEWAKEKGIDVDALLKAHGGLIGDREAYRDRGYVNSSSNPYSGVAGGYLDETLQSQQETPRPSLDVKGAPRPQPAKSGLGELTQLANLGKQGKSAFDWASKQLAGEASPTAMSATSTEALPGLAGGAETSTGALGAATAPAGGVIDLTTAAPGLAAAAPEALTAAAPEALGAGLLGGAAEVAAPVMTAAAEIPWFLAFLKDGGAVPHRKNYENRGLVVPEDTAEGGTETTTQGGDGETVVGRSAPLVRTTRPTPTPESAIAAVPAPRAREPGVAFGSRPSISDLGGLVPEGMKDTLSSENFWVPALAGVGAMLASPNKTLAGAIGSGLVGGTGAYTEMQKQNALQTKQRFELAKDLFKGPVEGEDKKLYWRHVPSGKLVPQEEYERLYSDFVRGSAGTPRITAPSSTTPAVEIAREEVSKEKPKIQPATTTAAPPAPAAKTEAAAEAPAPDTAQAQAAQASAPAPAEGQPPLKNKTQIKNEMLASPQTWADAPRERNPILLRQEAARLEGEVRQLRDKARRIATTMPENTTEGPRLTAEANQLDNNRKELIERSEKILEEAAEIAYDRQLKLSQGRTAQEIGRTAIPASPEAKLPEGKTVAQAENDPDYLGSRIESNMKKYAELKERGSLEEANKYLAAADKDRDRLEKVIGTEHTTSYGTKYSVHPNADVFNVTQPKPIPKDYKASVDPNTGIVVSKPIGEFIGYPETGGHPVDPALIGKKAVIKGEGDKRLMASKAQSDELEKGFVGGAEKAEEGIATILKFSTAAKVLESKGMNVPYAELANIARGLGFETLANQIMSEKNTAAAFTALKTNVDQAINQVTNNFARPTQAEFLITEKKATPSIDMPVDAARSLTQTRLAGLMWQNAILSDWENAKRETGATNFAAFRDVWQKTHPKALFEDAADRVLGNFKGQALPKPEKFAEGVVYVVPKNAGDTQVGRALVAKGLRPGDLFVMNGVNHEAKDIGEPMRVSPADAYKAHLRAPALTYGAR